MAVSQTFDALAYVKAKRSAQATGFDALEFVRRKRAEERAAPAAQPDPYTKYQVQPGALSLGDGINNATRPNAFADPQIDPNNYGPEIEQAAKSITPQEIADLRAYAKASGGNLDGQQDSDVALVAARMKLQPGGVMQRRGPSVSPVQGGGVAATSPLGQMARAIPGVKQARDFAYGAAQGGISQPGSGISSMLGTASGLAGFDNAAALFHEAANQINAQAPQGTGAAFKLGTVAGQVAPAVSAAATGGATSPLVMGLLSTASFGSGVQEYRNTLLSRGEKPTPGGELAVGLAFAGVEWITERVGLDAAMRKIPGLSDSLRAFRTSPTPAAAMKLVDELAPVMLSNAGEEISAQGGQNLIAKLKYDPNRDLTAGMGEAGLLGAAGGAMIAAPGAALNSLGAGFNAYDARRRAQQQPPQAPDNQTTPPDNRGQAPDTTALDEAAAQAEARLNEQFNRAAPVGTPSPADQSASSQTEQGTGADPTASVLRDLGIEPADFAARVEQARVDQYRSNPQQAYLDGKITREQLVAFLDERVANNPGEQLRRQAEARATGPQPEMRRVDRNPRAAVTLNPNAQQQDAQQRRVPDRLDIEGKARKITEAVGKGWILDRRFGLMDTRQQEDMIRAGERLDPIWGETIRPEADPATMERLGIARPQQTQAAPTQQAPQGRAESLADLLGMDSEADAQRYANTLSPSERERLGLPQRAPSAATPSTPTSERPASGPQAVGRTATGTAPDAGTSPSPVLPGAQPPASSGPTASQTGPVVGGGTSASPQSTREPWQMTRGEFKATATDSSNREDYARAWTPIRTPRGTPNTIEFVPYRGGNGADGVLRWNDEAGVGRGILAIEDGKITDVAVEKPFRRKGIATKLYAEAANRGATVSKNTTTPEAMLVRHKSAVLAAHAAGKPVPPEVLAEYGIKPQGTTAKDTPKYGIYPQAVKGRGTMFAVRESDNPNGYGDTIHATQEEAEKYAKEIEDRDRRNAESRERDRVAQEAKEREEAKRKAERENTRGFADSMPPMQRGKAIASLNTLIRVDGNADTIKAHVEKMVDAGGVELTTREEPKIKPMSRTEYNRASQREQEAHEKRMKEAGTKTVYMVNGYDLGKTAFDYAKHLTTQPQGDAAATTNQEPTNGEEEAPQAEVLTDGAPAPAASSDPRGTGAGEPDADAMLERIKQQLARGSGRQSADMIRAFQELGTSLVPGVRLQDAEEVGRMYAMLDDGTVTLAEYTNYIDDLRKSGKVSKAEEPAPAKGAGSAAPAKVEDKPAPAAREPWQMTKEEYVAAVLDGRHDFKPLGVNATPNKTLRGAKDFETLRKRAEGNHAAEVTIAYADGKPVRPDILAEYGLVSKPAPAKVEGKGKARAVADDIPISVAENAFRGTSFMPDKRARTWQSYYVNDFNALAEKFRKLADTDELRAAVEEELTRFREGLQAKYLAYLGAHSRVMSSMITGPARFPVESNRKKMDSADKRLAEIVEFVKRADKSITKRLFPQASGVIRSDDANAPDALRAAIEARQRRQEAMKEANKIVRKGGDKAAMITSLEGLGFSNEEARRVIYPQFQRGMGFPGYSLTNNNKEIRRLQERLTQLEAQRAREPRTATFPGGKVIENADAQRVQITFPSKPDEKTRENLKARGFKWAPSEGAWQRLMNEAAWRSALLATGANEDQKAPAQTENSDEIDAAEVAEEVERRKQADAATIPQEQTDGTGTAEEAPAVPPKAITKSQIIDQLEPKLPDGTRSDARAKNTVRRDELGKKTRDQLLKMLEDRTKIRQDIEATKPLMDAWYASLVQTAESAGSSWQSALKAVADKHGVSMPPPATRGEMAASLASKLAQKGVDAPELTPQESQESAEEAPSEAPKPAMWRVGDKFTFKKGYSKWFEGRWTVIDVEDVGADRGGQMVGIQKDGGVRQNVFSSEKLRDEFDIRPPEEADRRERELKDMPTHMAKLRYPGIRSGETVAEYEKRMAAPPITPQESQDAAEAQAPAPQPDGQPEQADGGEADAAPDAEAPAPAEEVAAAVETYTSDEDKAFNEAMKSATAFDAGPMATFFALPGKEAEVKKLAERASKIKGAEPAPKPEGSGPLRFPAGSPSKKVTRGKTIADAIASVYVAASYEDSRYSMNAVLVDAAGKKTKIVATDGRRMWMLTVPSSGAPKAGVYKAADNNKIGKGILESVAKKDPENEDAREFPPYQSVVDSARPASEQPTATFNAVMAANAIRRAAIMTTDESPGVLVVVNPDGTLGFAARDPELGTTQINVRDGYKELGGVNPTFFAEALDFAVKNGDDRVSMWWEKRTMPLTIKGSNGDTLTITMPINTESTVDDVRGVPRPSPSSGGASPGTAFRSAPTINDRAAAALMDWSNRARKRFDDYMGKMQRGEILGSGPPITPLIDLAAHVAFKALASGITSKSGRKLTAFVEGRMADIRAKWPSLNVTTATLRRQVRAMLAAANDDREKIIPAYAAARERVERQRTRATGKESGKPAEVREAVASATAERPDVAAKIIDAVRRGLRQGRAEGLRTASDAIKPLIRQARDAAKRARQVAEIEARGASEKATNAAKDQAATEKGIRAEAVRLVQETPIAGRRKYLTAVANAANMRDLAKILRRLRGDLAKETGRHFALRAERLEESFKKLDEKRLNPARKLLRDIRQMYAELKDKDTGVDQREELADSIRDSFETLNSIIHEQRAADKVFMQGRAIVLAEHRDQMMQAVQKQAELPKPENSKDDREPTWLRQKIRKYADFRTLMQILDRVWDETGIFSRARRAMESRRTAELAKNHEFIDKAEKIVQANGYKSWSDFMARSEGAMGDSGAEWVKIDLGAVDRLTVGQAMALYAQDIETKELMHAGQPWRLNRSGDSFVIDDYKLAELESKLTAGQKRIARQINQLRSEMQFDRADAVYKRITGNHMTRVDGHYPRKRILDKSGSEDTIDIAKLSMGEWAVQSLENSGFTIKRVQDKKTPLLLEDFGSTQVRSFQGTEMMIQRAEMVKYLKATLFNPAISDAIAQRYGGAMMKRITQVVAEYSGNSAPESDKFIRKVAAGTARSMTQVNPGTWLRNLSTVFRLPLAMIDGKMVGAGAVAAAIPKALLNWRSTLKILMQHSPDLRHRWSHAGAAISMMPTGATTDVDSHFADATKATVRQVLHAARAWSSPRTAGGRLRQVGKGWGQILDSIKVGNAFDAFAAVVAYHIARPKASESLSPGAADKWAARKAADAFMQTANTNDLLNANEWQTDAKRNTGAALILTFTSDIAKMQNLLFLANKRGGKARTLAAGAVAASLVWSVAVRYALASLLGDDDEKKDQEAINTVREELVSLIPGGTNLWNPLLDTMTRGGRTRLSVLDTPLTSIVRHGEALVNEMRKEDGDPLEMAYRASRVFLDPVGNPLAPISGMARRAFKNYAE